MAREIDSTVNKLENADLYYLDDLSNRANENLEQRKDEIDRARTIWKSHAWNMWLQLRRRTLMATRLES